MEFSMMSTLSVAVAVTHKICNKDKFPAVTLTTMALNCYGAEDSTNHHIILMSNSFDIGAQRTMSSMAVIWRAIMVSSSNLGFSGFSLLCLLLFSPWAAAIEDEKEVGYILNMEVAPLGVVFEIVESSPDALSWAIPQVVKFSKQLREKFPDIAIAVVSHGKEQFGLMKSEQEANSKVHKAVKSLLAEDVPVHVCGTHASWYGKGEEDFPDYIDVTPAGPTQIANYEDMGYEKVVLDPPSDN
jgi:intracellular sulfur oxidation DsrE/DsrF family protein